MLEVADDGVLGDAVGIDAVEVDAVGADAVGSDVVGAGADVELDGVVTGCAVGSLAAAQPDTASAAHAAASSSR